MNDAEAEAAYTRYYVPAPGRVVYALEWANRRTGAPVEMQETARV
jgi:hypothetical protein